MVIMDSDAANATSASQPASLNYSNYYPAAASHIADTAPTTSYLPQFPSSTPTSYGASNSSSFSALQQPHHNPWQQLQPTAPDSSSFLLADIGLQTGNDDLFAMLAAYSRPPSGPAPFSQLAVPPPQQPQVQMQFASSPNPPAPRRKASAVSNSAGTSRRVRQPAVQAANAIAVATSSEAGPCINPTTSPDQEQCPLQSTSTREQASTMEKAIQSYADTVAPIGDECANKPAPRRRGRPRKPASSTSRPAPRRKASAAKLAAESRQLQSTSSNKCAWEVEASMMEEEIGSYADMTVPGVRFQPNKEEIIGFLRMKYLGRKMPVDFFTDFNVYQAHPETLQASCGESVSGYWYVFSPRKRRYPYCNRPARSVGEVGFWKSNTKETDILCDGAVIGKVTSLTFELGHQPKGTQTPWKMKEHSLPEKQYTPDGSSMQLDDWVLCKIYNRDELDGLDEDAVETEGDKDVQIVTVEQGNQTADDAGEDAGETEGDANTQIVPDEHTLSDSIDEQLCVEDYLLSDSSFGYQDHAEN